MQTGRHAKIYDQQFFTLQQERIKTSPRVVLPLLFQILPTPKTVVDVGCGTGEWLQACKELGVRDILGIDGSYVDPTLLRIESSEFLCRDLTQRIDVNRRFDLAICLEVAEHLPRPSAELLVTSLCAFSDAVLFSAASPGQGGTHHINEQWPNYWAELFSRKNFGGVDCLRPLLWENEAVAPYYRQNIILYRAGFPRKSILARMHHGVYVPTIRQCLKLLTQAIAMRLKRRKENPNP